MSVNEENILGKITRSKGYSISYLAKGLKKDRSTLYRKFQDSEDQIDLVFAKELGELINYDFGQHLPALLRVTPPPPPKEYPVPEMRAIDVVEEGKVPYTLPECHAQLMKLQSEHIALLRYTNALLQQQQQQQPRTNG